MNTAGYLNKFQQSVEQLDQTLFNKQQLEIKVGVWLDSVVLKIQSKAWLGNPQLAKPFEGSIFFSVWVSEESLKTNKLYYNIHALKLRELRGYKITSRDFAQNFRLKFKAFENQWPNVSVDFGPLTLMEGWVVFNEDNLKDSIATLTKQFSAIAFIIDDLLASRKKI